MNKIVESYSKYIELLEKVGEDTDANKLLVGEFIDYLMESFGNEPIDITNEEFLNYIRILDKTGKRSLTLDEVQQIPLSIVPLAYFRKLTASHHHFIIVNVYKIKSWDQFVRNYDKLIQGIPQILSYPNVNPNQ